MKIFFYTFLILLLVDVIVYFGTKKLFEKPIRKKQFAIIFWFITILFFLVFIGFLLYAGKPKLDIVKFRHYFYFFGITILLYLPKIILLPFIFIEFIFNSLKLFRKSKYITKAGVIVSALLFVNIFYGITYNKTNFRVNQITLEYKNLPKSFDGFKIVQFSDAHLGSFSGTESVKKGLDMINNQQADLIVFTGDLVNITADEATPYIPMLNQLHASHGLFAILGNHDMNDYRKVDSIKAEPLKHLNELISTYQKTPFHLLLDEHVILRKGNDSIVLIGIRNWGKPPFHKYGDLAKAMKGVNEVPFKILLSHDPSHWDAEVKNKTDVALTLSGHTHGFQFGINTKWFRWSPVQYQYHKWAGLYSENNQSLYVNVGFGYIGFPGRVGIRPEITVITLKTKK